MKLLLLAAIVACGACRGRSVVDPIEGFPDNQQQTLTRGAIEKNWPLSVGQGTLGCLSDAVVFRAGGLNYAVNDAARAKGFASIEAIRSLQPAKPPSNPLGRLRQDDRTRIFAESSACQPPAGAGAESACVRDIRARYRISEADLKQITVEGNERLWPPLQRVKADLQPLVDSGLKLCKP